MYRTFRFHSSRSGREERLHDHAVAQSRHQQLEQLLQSQMAGLMQECSSCLDLALRGLIQADEKLLRQTTGRIEELRISCASKELNFVRILKKLQPDIDHDLIGRLKLLSCQQDLFQSVQTIVDAAKVHVLDGHGELTEQTRDILAQFNVLQRQVIQLQEEAWKTADNHGEVRQGVERLHRMLSESIQAVVDDLYGGVRPVSFTTLLLTLLTELQDFATELDRASMLWRDHVEPRQKVPAPG
jgi:hypothetical protein